VRRVGVKLNLTTNGTFPRRGARKWAERIVPVTSDTKISINGATAETQEAVMLGTRWEQVIDNVRDFVAVRDVHAREGKNYCRVTFQTTFLETNVANFPTWCGWPQHSAWTCERPPSLGALHADRRALDAASAGFLGAMEPHSGETEQAAAQHLLPSGKPVLLENIHRLNLGDPGDIAPADLVPFLARRRGSVPKDASTRAAPLMLSDARSENSANSPTPRS